MEEDYKEVLFDKYCSTCKYCDLDDKFDPCNECLESPMILNSEKPTMWEKK